MDYQGDDRKTAAFEKEGRAQRISLGDFSEQLTAGVLRAVETHVRDTGGGRRWPPHPVIWCGIYVRPPEIGPFDPQLAEGAEKL
jgi:hypothetical protein